jgi:hypothetical protein
VPQQLSLDSDAGISHAKKHTHAACPSVNAPFTFTERMSLFSQLHIWWSLLLIYLLK